MKLPVSSLFRPMHSLAAALAIVLTPALLAADGTWDANADGNWNTAGNWLGSTIAAGPGFTAFFTSELTTARTVTLGEARIIGNITFTDGATSSHDLTITGADILTLAGANPTIKVTQADRTLTIASEVAGVDGLTKSGAGALSLTGINSYTGATTISSGALTLSGAGGSIATSSGITLGYSGALTLSNTSAANNAARIGNSAGLTTNGGTFNFTNDGSDNAFAETLGALTLSTGAFTLNSSQAGAAGSSALTLDSISRSANGGTALFSGTGFGADTRNQVLVTSDLSAANVAGILPWALIKDGSTYDLAVGGTGGAAITKFTGYDTASANATWGATVNARPSAAILPTGPKSLNSLVLDNGINFNGTAQDRTITIGSATQAGLIVQTGGSSTIFRNSNNEYILAFGTREGIFHTVGDLTFQRGNTISITGSGGITKTGPGTLTLGESNRTFEQTVTGKLSLNEGLYFIYSSSVSALSNFTSIDFNGGNLSIFESQLRSFNNPLNLNADATVTLDRRGAGGEPWTATFGALTINNNPNLTLVTGPGAVIIPDTQQVQIMATGAVTLNSDATFTLTDGLYVPTRLSLGAVTNGGNSITLKGNGEFVQTGAWGAGSGGLTLDSTFSGVATLSQANAYTGATTISGGTLALGASNVLSATTPVSLGAATLAVGAGFTDATGTLAVKGSATIDLGDGTSAIAFADSSGLAWTGGALNITGTFVSGSSLRFGTTSAGLTDPQLAQITATGFSDFDLDANGYLIATPDGDIIPPQLVSIVANQAGPINVNTLVTYTVTFNEDMDASTVTDLDFGNAGTSTISIGTIAETTATSGIFTVQVTPTTAGTLQLRINQGAVLKDIAANNLDTTNALTGGGPVITVNALPPTLTGIADNQGGGPINVNTLVTYTVTFNEDMDASTFSAADFGNAGSSDITIGTIAETTATSGIFTVQVTPTTAGTLQLRINQGASLNSALAVALNTSTALTGGGPVITVNSTNPFATWAEGAAFDDDHNGDGVSNGLAWLLGALNKNTNAQALLPQGSVNGGDLILTFTCLKVAGRGGAVLKVQYSKDLGVIDAWHDAEVPNGNGTVNSVVFNATDDGDYIDVIATIPASAAAPGTKLFGRLVAVNP